jgi:hypothetical protein
MWKEVFVASFQALFQEFVAGYQEKKREQLLRISV